jgi:hypothetical protein
MTIIDSAQHWRDRAAEARAMGAQIEDLAAKQAMLTIAENYEKIASRAKTRLSRREIAQNAGLNRQS